MIAFIFKRSYSLFQYVSVSGLELSADNTKARLIIFCNEVVLSWIIDRIQRLANLLDIRSF